MHAIFSAASIRADAARRNGPVPSSVRPPAFSSPRRRDEQVFRGPQRVAPGVRMARGGCLHYARRRRLVRCRTSRPKAGGTAFNPTSGSRRCGRWWPSGHIWRDSPWTSRGAGATQRSPARRPSHDQSRRTRSVPAGMSISIMSPGSIRAIGPPDGGLGADVADRRAGRPAGEPAVGHQGALVAQADPLDGGGRREHLLHAGPALGAPRGGSRPRRRPSPCRRRFRCRRPPRSRRSRPGRRAGASWGRRPPSSPPRHRARGCRRGSTGRPRASRRARPCGSRRRGRTRPPASGGSSRTAVPPRGPTRNARHAPGPRGSHSARANPSEQPSRVGRLGLPHVVGRDILAERAAGDGPGREVEQPRAAARDLAQDRVNSPGAGHVLDVVEPDGATLQMLGVLRASSLIRCHPVGDARPRGRWPASAAGCSCCRPSPCRGSWRYRTPRGWRSREAGCRAPARAWRTRWPSARCVEARS